MPRRVTDQEIRKLLHLGLTVPEVADQLRVPIRRVARVKTGGRSAHDYRQGPPEVVGMKLPPGVHLAARPSPQYASYWETLHPPKPKPRRRARLVPDDRSDEYPAAHETTRNDGRGAA